MRTRRWPWVLLGVVVVLVGLAVAADRIVLRVAEDKAASALQQSQGLDRRPSVSFAGFPFLTQLASGRFDEVVVGADDVTVGRTASLRVARVTVHLYDVTARNGYHDFTAQRARAAATVDPADLSATLGVQVRTTNDGRLAVRRTVTVGGRTVTGTVSAGVRASNAGGLRFVDPRVVDDAGHALPAPVAQELAAVFARRISLAGLPFDVRVTGAAVTPQGVVLQLSGRHLTYSR